MKRSATPTTTPESLSTYIQARFDDFSRSQKDVAQYIVDHLDEAAFHTAEELAKRANTSSSTVVRFSQALGFEGFPELQAAARDEYRSRGPQGQPEAEPLFSLDHGASESAVAADSAATASAASAPSTHRLAWKRAMRARRSIATAT